MLQGRRPDRRRRCRGRRCSRGQQGRLINRHVLSAARRLPLWGRQPLLVCRHRRLLLLQRLLVRRVLLLQRQQLRGIRPLQLLLLLLPQPVLLLQVQAHGQAGRLHPGAACTVALGRRLRLLLQRRWLQHV